MTSTPAEYGRFWFDSRKLVSLVERSIDRRLRSEVGISETLFLVLSVIDVQPGAFNQQGVADFLGTTSATVSRQLETGAKAGYLTVTVSPSSRRENAAQLTDSGRAVIRAGDAIILDETKRMLADVTPDEFAVTSAAIQAMLGSMRPGADPRMPSAPTTITEMKP